MAVKCTPSIRTGKPDFTGHEHAGSRRRIMDVDVAEETANLAKQQILVQASAAMVAECKRQQCSPYAPAVILLSILHNHEEHGLPTPNHRYLQCLFELKIQTACSASSSCGNSGDSGLSFVHISREKNSLLSKSHLWEVLFR